MNRIVLTLIYIVIALSCSSNNDINIASQNCGIFEGTAIFGSQLQIDEFGKCNYTTITGDLVITDYNTGHPVTDLTPLRSLRSVEGNILQIIDTGLITNLEGLNNITSIKSLQIGDNDSLENLDGLNNLEPEIIHVWGNRSLKNLDHLNISSNTLKSVYIANCPLLTSIQCFSNVIEVTGLLSIEGNPSLLDLEGLNNIESIGINQSENVCCSGSLNISNNINLQSLDALMNLKAIHQGLTINRNTLITDLDGLSQLTTFKGDLKITRNESLTNINSLSSITEVYDLEIKYSNIQNLDGLANLIKVRDKLNISNNSSLSDFCGLVTLFDNNGLKDQCCNYSVVNNEYNPSRYDIANERCSK